MIFPEFETKLSTISKRQSNDDYHQFYGFADIENTDYYAGYLDSSLFKIFVQVWSLSKMKGLIIITHGYLDHAGLYQHIIKFFLKNSYGVLIFDLPGHGLSSGDRGSIKNFSDYSLALKSCLQWAEKKFNIPWYLIGQSTGAAIITNSLACDQIQYDFPIKKIIFLAPLVRIYRWKLTRLLYYIMKPFCKNIKRTYSINSHDDQFCHFVRYHDPLQIKTIALEWLNAMYHWDHLMKKTAPTLDTPLLVIQGKDDNVVDWRYNLPQLKKIYSLSDIFYLEQGHHHLANEILSIRTIFLQKSVQWLMQE